MTKRTAIQAAIIFLAVFNCDFLVARADNNDLFGTVEKEAATFLQQLELKYTRACYEDAVKSWNYETNITEETQGIAVASAAEFAALQASVQKEILRKFPNWRNFQDGDIRRQFRFVSIRGPANMDPAKVKEQTKVGAELETAYSSAKVCDYKTRDDPKKCRRLNLDPEINELMKQSRDFDELAYYWDAWHDTMAQAVPLAKYKRFMDLDNEYANANNFSNMAAMWAFYYDDDTPDFSYRKFRAEMLEIWKQIKPYYDILHAYVRLKLKQKPEYSEKLKQYEPYLPGNVLGSMWALEWTAVSDATKPFQHVPSYDVTKALNDAGFTPKLMFRKTEEFFESLGLPAMTETFWNKSMIEKPEGREVVCHGSSIDLCLGKGSTDFRIKMCTTITQEDLYVVHHEMGHIEYFMAYRDQPFIFRDGANPGFHEAIGDTIALSVSTPRHLQCQLGLNISENIDCRKVTPNKSLTPEDLNFLYFVALEKLPLYSYALSLELWRWGIYEGSIPEAEFNTKWWEIRKEFQGIVSPNPRNLTGGLDAAAKYHTVADIEYIRYFLSHVLQFQFYEAMCIKAGQFDPTDPNSPPLHQCDFGGSKDAGASLSEMMRLGLSKPWPEALQVLTGSAKVRVEPVLNYFKPLITHLQAELSKMNERY